jgi:hypothetical protein
MSEKLKEDLVSSFNKFIEDNKELKKTDLLKVINDVYVRNKVAKEKRPLSAYQIFMKEHYASVQEEEKKKGEIKKGQVLSAIGRLWKLKKEGKEDENEEEEEEEEKSEEEEKVEEKKEPEKKEEKKVVSSRKTSSKK